MRTTPAMMFPRELMMPEAVRISVSMRSFSTGARAGRAICNSVGVAARQEGFDWAPTNDGGTRMRSKVRREGFIGRVSFEMYDTSLEGDGCGVSAIADTKFPEQAIDMRFDCGFTDLQVGGDLLICAASHDAFQNFQFAVGKGLSAHSFGELF